jgi:class 3 adenylate cyclase/tetratricopeptide (TPR) repeat protein
MACATEIGAPPTSAPNEERKVVTVLFCDLVGFTARSESADPEDVRATLEPYHRLVRRQLERYGGTVEKFIGDAVMAVFGAPVAHEDDAERAIRAALRVIEEIEAERGAGLDVDIRIGINTGETVVALAARPEHGEAMVAGDVVNTASRIQGIAPVNSVAVAEPTYRLTKDLFEFEALEPMTVKGKVEPVVLHRVIEARSRFGTDVTDDVSTPFVGREEERTQLESTLRRTIRESSVQLVTVVGEPGVGKSRLVRELFIFIDELDELISWRQGRCLPYGEGVTFWALADMVKAQAGILETDAPETAGQKVRTAVSAVVDDEDEQTWIATNLEPLVGLGRDRTLDQEEAFTAWTRFFEEIAATGPVILVVEDLHWADEPLLAYLEHLIEYARDVPILVVATARPDLFERAPGWGGGKRNAQTLALSALAQNETSLLVSALLEQSVLPAEVHALVLEKSGGNPLYAEQFIRMLRDRGLLEERGRTLALTDDGDVSFPESVHALIAARLDTLDANRKAFLQDASIVGKVFWSGAVAAIGQMDEGEVRHGLHELVKREFVRPSRITSVRATQEYAFWHVLVRDVAYAQIPRAARADKHIAAATWIEAVAVDRLADHAEVLAYHYLEALELHRSAGTPRTETLVMTAVRFLMLAGERALGLDAKRAEGHLRKALALVGEADAPATEIRVKLAEALESQGEHLEAVSLLETAADEAERRGDLQLAGLALTRLSNAMYYVVGSEPSMPVLERAIELLEREPAAEPLALALTEMVGALAVSGSPDDAIAWADRAIELATSLSLERSRIAALGFRGVAYGYRGDPRAVDDLERALSLALTFDLARETGLIYNNLGIVRWALQSAPAATDTLEEGRRFAERRGLSGVVRYLRETSLAPLFDLGRWDELLHASVEMEGYYGTDMSSDIVGDSFRALIATYRGGDGGRHAEAAVIRAREFGGRDVLITALAAVSVTRASGRDPHRAAEVLMELAEMGGDDSFHRDLWLGPLARCCIACDDVKLLQRFVASGRGTTERSRMMLSAAKGVLAEAADVDDAGMAYRRAIQAARGYGSLIEEAHASLGLGRWLSRIDATEALQHLVVARDVFAALGARHLSKEANDRLDGTDVYESG